MPQIADQLLELNEHPRVVTDSSISTYIRQYSGEIDTLYGRDINGYILNPSSLARNIDNAIKSGDMELVSQTMADEGFDYLVLNGETDESFQIIDRVGDYGIYKSLKKPSMIKKRNELGQVVSITTVDESGNPAKGENVYTTAAYEYDGNGYVRRKRYTDEKGQAVADGYGCSGYEREYDQNGHVILECRIDSAGNAVINGLGYAEYRREYKDNNIISESYYGTDGKPINCINGYHRDEREYDENHNIVLQRFLNTDGDLVITGCGYAEVHRVFKDNHLIQEEYYGSDGKPYRQPAGYTAIVQEWDGDNLISRTYLGDNRTPTNRTDGYSKAVWEQEKTCYSVKLYDVNGDEVLIGGLNLIRVCLLSGLREPSARI